LPGQAQRGHLDRGPLRAVLHLLRNGRPPHHQPDHPPLRHPREDSYELHYQHTETPTGTFWCVTHVDLDRNQGDAITFGTTDAMSHWFRGSDTTRRATSTCPDPSCCHQPDQDAASRWDNTAWPSARDHSQFVSGLPTDTVTFDPHPGVDLIDVYTFLDRHVQHT
jgi:hypothetical protein